MSTPFADPAVPTGIEYPELQGVLLLVEVLSVEDHVPTVHTKPGERNPAIRANITALDGAQAGRVYEDALVFPKVLQSQLRSRVGKMVLGRLAQGEAKPGQTAPWKLDPASEADRHLAERALSSGRTGSSQPPQQQQGSLPFGGNQQAEPPF